MSTILDDTLNLFHLIEFNGNNHKNVQVDINIVSNPGIFNVEVITNQRVIHHQLLDELLANDLGVEQAQNPSPSHLLTEREWEIARLVMHGYSTKQIAVALYIVVGTVRNHLKNIYRKLDVCSRVQLCNKLNQYIDLLQSDLTYK